MMKLWNQRNTTKLSVKEIETTVKSVYETALRRKPVPEYADVHKGEETENLGGKGFTLTGFEEYMKIYGDMPVDWIIPGWMPDATICFLVSPPGSYKSWLLYDLAVSTAMGGKFLGQYQVRLPGPVFLVQQEDHHGQTAQRIEVIRRSKVQEAMEQSTDNESDITYDMPKTMSLFVHTDRQLKFDSKEAVKDLCAAIEKYRPKLVIIDPLYSAASTDDYMNKAIDSMFFLKDMRDKFGTTFIIAHHSNKSEREDRMRAWGSQFLNAFLETGWQIFKQSDKSIVVKRHFKIAGNPEETCLTFDINTETGFYYKVKEGLVKAKRDKKTEVVMEDIDTFKEEREDQAKEIQADMAKLESKALKVRPDSPAILNFLLTRDDFVTKNQIVKYFGHENWRDWISQVLETMANNQLIEYKYYANAKLGWQHQYKARKKKGT
jgi:archaellum biogenesis ATPase FlaH